MVLVHASRMPLSRIILALLPFIASDALTAEPEQANPGEYFFTLTFGNLPEELQAAREEGKLGLLLFFEADDVLVTPATSGDAT